MQITLTWSRIAYLAGIVLALVLVVPVAWFPVQLGKLTVFTVLLAVSVLLLVWSGSLRSLLRAHGFYPVLAVGLLPLIYIISSRFSIDPSLAWTGAAIDTDTVVFATLAFLSFVVAFAHFRTLRTLRVFLAVLGGALVLAAIFQLGSILFGTPLGGGGDRSVNLVGKWNDLGLLVALLGVLLMAQLELSPISARMRSAAIAGLVLVGALLTFIQFGVAWALILGAAVIIALVSYLSQREGAGKPIVSSIMALFAVLSLVFGATFNVALTSLFPVSALEVRPAASTTFEIISQSYNGSVGRLAVGMGPNTFSRQWLELKPAEVNQSQFWSLDFNVGFSTLSTALLTVGIVGVLAWLMPLFLVLAGVVRALRRSVLRSEDRSAAVSVALAAIVVYAALAFYVPSQNIILLAFVLSGAAFGFLWRQGQQSAEHEPAGESRVRQLVLLAFIAALVALTVLVSMLVVRRFVATGYILTAEQALSQGRTQDAIATADASARIEESSGALRMGVDASYARLGQLSQATSSTPALQDEFTSTVQNAIARGQRAIQLSPTDYRSYLSLGSIYTLLTSLKVDGAYQNALDTYAAAASYNPTSPAIPLMVARVEALQENTEGVEANLTKALTLKPNYTDAMLFTVELSVAQGDLPSAVRAAEAAAQTAPGVASIWFQLGLLQAASNDVDKAVSALENALQLVPDYANAKYYLGISYYQQKKTEEALSLFEDLKRTNPNVAELDTVIANMRAGRPALEGLTPPAEAPVAE